MKKYSTNRNNLPNYDERYMKDAIVYNRHRQGLFENFDSWFDKKECFISNNICDLSNPGKLQIDLRKFGNNSGVRSYRQIQQGEDWIPEFRPRDEEEYDTQNYYGTYTRMRSPGIIKLNTDLLQVGFWSIICELCCSHNYIFTREKIEELASLFIHKTLYHELFHHFTDAESYFIVRHVYDYEIEEALAVACSRLLVGYDVKNNHSYVSDFLDLAYQYNRRGYSDWILYKSEEQFFLKLIEYMPIPNQLSMMGQELIPIADSLLTAIIENPNVEVIMM